jgi:putative transcriptional regulator
MLYIVILCKNQVKEMRTQKSMTQEALALACGVTRQTIISIEKEKFIPSVKLAMEIAHTLSISVDELFWLAQVERKDE